MRWREREREGGWGKRLEFPSFPACVASLRTDWAKHRERERERRAKIEFEFHHSRSVFRLNNDDHFVIGFFLSLFKKTKKKKTKERVGTESTSAHA